MIISDPELTLEPTAYEASCCDIETVSPLSTEVAHQVADDLQVLGHPIRLQILSMLSQSSCEICVCDIESALPVKQPTVSHHLKLLREAGLIDCEKRGLYAYYFVRRDALQTLWGRVIGGLDGVI